jgi:hypothetical protein
MTMIAFTKNHSDHSTDTGFQFEFHCDRCGNGHMTPFQTSKLGVAAGLARAASSLLGGFLGSAAAAGDSVKDTFRGQARDQAFAAAVAEARQHFRQCSRCGSWVCPEHCWNEKRGLCEQCAPDLEEEAAAAQAQAAKEQVWEKALKTDQLGDLDVKTPKTALCPHCGKKTGGGKFCAECGKPLAAKVTCPSCGKACKAGTKFCPECGAKLG